MAGKKGQRGPRKGKGLAVKFLRDHASYSGADCVIWPFALASGYGQFGDMGKHYRAHRYMCELAYGPAPTPKHQAAHSCGDSRCVNPLHLAWKTNAENQRDKIEHGVGNFAGSRGYLSLEIAQEIRELSKTLSHAKIAERYGIGRSHVGRIVRNTIWTGQPRKRRSIAA